MAYAVIKYARDAKNKNYFLKRILKILTKIIKIFIVSTFYITPKIFARRLHHASWSGSCPRVIFRRHFLTSFRRLLKKNFFTCKNENASEYSLRALQRVVEFFSQDIIPV